MARKLEVEIVGDASSYQRALKTADTSSESFGRGVANMGKIAAAGFAVLGAGAVVGINKMISAASDMGETVSKTNTVFGDSGEAVVAWGETLATTFGLSKQQALDAASIFGTFGKAAGLTGDALTQFSKPLVQAAGDLASFHNVPVAQALEDIRSGLSGEVEPLRKYGILLNDSTLRQEALKLGLVKTTKDALSPQNKMLASQKLILEKLGPATGDFARTSDSAANQQRILSAEVSNLSANLGGKLLPMKVAVLGMLTGIVDSLGKIGQAKGFTAKVNVAVDIAKDAFNSIREKINDALFGSFSKGGGVGPEGIKFNQGIVQKITDAFAKLDWTATGKSIIDGIVNALKTAGELAKALADTVMNAVRKINWEGVGRVIGPGLAAAIVTAFTTLMDPAFWARNWDLALSIALVAFSGPIGKIAGKLAPLLAKVGGDLVLGIAGGIEKFAPKLAEVFLAGMEVLGRLATTGAQKVAQLVGAGLGALEGIVRGIFGKLGGLAVLAIKVLGINAAIDAIAQFAVKVGGWFADLGRSIAGFFEDAWAGIKRGALVAALAVVEPFSHLPSKLGGWARSAKDSMQAELAKLNAEAIAQKLVDQMDDKAGAMRTAGTNLANSLAKGVTDGLKAQLLTVGQSIASFIASAGAYARKNTGSTTEEYAAKILGKPIGQGTITGVESMEKLLGASLVKLIRASFAKAAEATDKGSKDLGKSMIKGLSPVGNMIVDAAKKWGIDAKAALAVAMTEGGLKFGAVGDKGQSFGPFQLATFGELSGKTAAQAKVFANSVEGINFALRRMAEEGAKGLTGLAAMKQIIGGPGWGFERPANAVAELQKAIGYYKQFGAVAVEAITQGRPMITAAQEATLTGLSNLVKKYGPIIGLEHAKGIIAGMFQGEPGVVAQAKQLLEAAHQAQLQKIKDAKEAFRGAFSDLANAALAAFDEKMAKWKPPSGTLLEAFKLQDQIGQMTAGLGPAVNAAEQRLAAAFSSGNKQAIDQAQNDLNAALTNAYNAVDANTTNMLNAASATLQQAQAEGDPDKIATAQAAYDQALTDRTTAFNQNIADQRALIEQNLQYRADAEQRTHDAIAAKQREGLAKQLYELQQWLLKHPAKWAEMGVKVQAVLTKYNVTLKTAGHEWADKFGEGITAGIPAAVKAAHALAAAVAAVLPSKKSPLQPAKQGPLAFHPYDMGKDWATALGSGLTAGRLPTTMAGMAAAPGGLAFAAGGGGGAAVVNVYVSGTVVTENQLVDAVYRGLVRKSGRNSGNLGLA